MTAPITRPASDEHAPYYQTYVDAAAKALEARGLDDVVTLMSTQAAEFHALLDTVDPSRAGFAYAPGKWTLAESLVHVADTERVFAYRLLRIARGDTTPLPGFDQDTWVPQSRATQRPIAAVLREIDATRASTLALIHSLDTEAIAQRGTASTFPVTARALVWILAGHMAHHLEITRTRYLAA